MKLSVMQIHLNRFNGYIQVFSLLFDIWNSYVNLCHLSHLSYMGLLSISEVSQLDILT